MIELEKLTEILAEMFIKMKDGDVLKIVNESSHTQLSFAIKASQLTVIRICYDDRGTPTISQTLGMWHLADMTLTTSIMDKINHGCLRNNIKNRVGKLAETAR